MVGWNKNRLFRPKSMLPDAVRGKRSVLMMFFSIFGRALLQSYGHQASNGQRCMAPF